VAARHSRAPATARTWSWCRRQTAVAPDAVALQGEPSNALRLPDESRRHLSACSSRTSSQHLAMRHTAADDALIRRFGTVSDRTRLFTRVWRVNHPSATVRSALVAGQVQSGNERRRPKPDKAFAMPGRLDAQSLDLARRWRNSVDLENEDIDPSWWEDVLSAAILDAYEAPELMSSHLQRAALADGVGEASVKNQAMASPCSHEGFLSAVLDRADELITGTRRRGSLARCSATPRLRTRSNSPGGRPSAERCKRDGSRVPTVGRPHERSW
jgi:hypothetical protein